MLHIQSPLVVFTFASQKLVRRGNRAGFVEFLRYSILFLPSVFEKMSGYGTRHNYSDSNVSTRVCHQCLDLADAVFGAVLLDLCSIYCLKEF